VLALGAAACGGGGEDNPAPGDGASGGTYSVTITNPENPLVPTNTTESEGSLVLSGLFTGLVDYDPETSEVVYEGVAASIESDDSTTWTVKLKDGWTFHDGSKVDAASFVDAWNYGALSTNAQGAASFFSNIAGYADVQAPEGGQPKAKTMSGLKVVDPLTFTVTLSSPFAQFPLTVGYNAFYPLPKAFFADPVAFGKKPVGNGPFQAQEAFQPDRGFTLTRYEEYAGEPAKADAVEVKVIADINTQYLEVQAGNLDVLDQIPPDAISSAPDEFGDRYLTRPSSSTTYLNFPTYDPRFADKRVRQAFSMAIDRKAITEAVFNGTREPAYSAISPVVDGSREDACRYCEYKPDEAKKLLAETEFDTSKPVDLWFNAGAGHDEWVQAVGNSLRDNLGITYKLQGGLMFAEYLPKQDAKQMTGPFRSGWSMDYPSPQNYLEPLYGTAALPPNGSNTSFFSNPEFDALIAKGNRAASNEDAIKAYQEAEDLLLEEMPVAPMFFGQVQAVHSERVANVVVDAFGTIQLADVTVRD
jgi:ABC-type oligopeptide transport system substrate-binding subunit